MSQGLPDDAPLVLDLAGFRFGSFDQAAPVVLRGHRVRVDGRGAVGEFASRRSCVPDGSKG